MSLRFNFTFLRTKYCHRYLTLSLCYIKIERPFVPFLKNLLRFMCNTMETFAASVSGFSPNYQPVACIETAGVKPFIINAARSVSIHPSARELDIASASPEIQEHPCGMWHRTFPGAAGLCLLFNVLISSECFRAA